MFYHFFDAPAVGGFLEILLRFGQVLKQVGAVGTE
jgi:hypothetical protein